MQDANDDMLLEAAANGGCNAIVTHNVRDFAPARSLGIPAITPTEFMSQRKENPR